METVPVKPATIRDVAKLAGVGLGTVSRVINNSPLVSEATRERVNLAIADLTYVPNPTARRLSLRKTLTIAAIAPFFTRPSFTERLRGIENSLAESEYDLIIYNVETVERRESLIREIPRRERVDGVIIIALSPREEDIPFLSQADVPVVLVDTNHPSLTMLNRVVVDDIEGGYTATQHLINLGHRRIGYISDPLENPFNFTSSLYRYRGYTQALEDAGISYRHDYHGQGEHGRYEAHRLSKQMLSLPDRPTAIFAASDTQAMGVMEAARELKMRIPDDLSVIGYDDIEVAEYLGLTTIRQLLFESGQRGVDILLNALENPSKGPVCEKLPTELIVRQTTATPSAG
ncbi:MAG: LacI family DNA-binding transcriptional regulator [Anaerolineales bacterium]|nr:LacI family DNA-binding transcriptional regulator [Anaerolineales bacterium]